MVYYIRDSVGHESTFKDDKKRFWWKNGNGSVILDFSFLKRSWHTVFSFHKKK